METTVTGRHIEITAPIREYAEKRAEKLPKYYDRVRSIDVIADKSDNHVGFVVEMIVHVDQSDPFVAKADGEDLYACIDDTTHKLQRLLTDYKEKLRSRKH